MTTRRPRPARGRARPAATRRAPGAAERGAAEIRGAPGAPTAAEGRRSPRGATGVFEPRRPEGRAAGAGSGSRGRRAETPRAHRDPAYVYQPDYVSDGDRDEVMRWLAALHPLWELRYSTRRPLPPGRTQRQLLRPVYWLGNWQFACLGYFTPPRGLRDRCVAAEPYPPALARWVADVEARVRRGFPPADVPRGWKLNTCLVNFYGSRRDGDRWVDVARVGEHRDAEPGPVASISLGERALFQFVARGAGGAAPARTQWLDDGSLQIFAGPRWKDHLLHRVQRVDTRRRLELPPAIDRFRTRRINFTFRYVPDEHVVPLARLSAEARADVEPYVRELAATSPFWRAALAAAG